jgi:hypothetical protein
MVILPKLTASCSGKGLAAHLEVPLPYLLYRVNARFQEEIRGLKDISGALSPTVAGKDDQSPQIERPSVAGRIMGGSSRLALSNALPSPIGVRARLNSLGSNSVRHKKGTSSSTITVQAAKHQHPPPTLLPRPTTPSSSEEDSTDSEDEEALKEEELDRKAEEQEALDRKLQELQQMMTNDTLGLVTSRERKGSERGRRWPPTSSSVPSLAVGGYRHRDDTSLSIRSNSTSQSVSSASSPQGSIPDIPSPSAYGGGSQPHSPMGRHMSPSKSSSPPSVSSGVATGKRYAPLSLSDQGSNQGSETSSFSDISGK